MDKKDTSTRDSNKTKVNCSHCVGGRTHVITGKPSSMRMVKNMQDFFIERCKYCTYEHTVKKSTEYNKIKNNAAQGIRDQNMVDHWEDALQPLGPDGRENKIFTKKYGWNPHSQDPRVPKELPNPLYDPSAN